MVDPDGIDTVKSMGHVVLLLEVVGPDKYSDDAFPPEYTELAEVLDEPEPLNPVAEPTKDTPCPEQIETSDPALAAEGASIPEAEETVTFAFDAPDELTSIVPE
tara:strand:+ start:284 stop:595 length:312 start_codon:yes stop_codon:yes gene_type:complete